MWDDERQLNAAAATLALMAVVALAWAGGAWLVRQPAFAFREVVVTTPLSRANGAYLEAVVRSELSGTFFTLDLARARQALAQVPWVRTAGLRRQWPRRLEIRSSPSSRYWVWMKRNSRISGTRPSTPPTSRS